MSHVLVLRTPPIPSPLPGIPAPADAEGRPAAASFDTVLADLDATAETGGDGTSSLSGDHKHDAKPGQKTDGAAKSDPQETVGAVPVAATNLLSLVQAAFAGAGAPSAADPKADARSGAEASELPVAPPAPAAAACSASKPGAAIDPATVIPSAASPAVTSMLAGGPAVQQPGAVSNGLDAPDSRVSPEVTLPGSPVQKVEPPVTAAPGGSAVLKAAAPPAGTTAAASASTDAGSAPPATSAGDLRQVTSAAAPAASPDATQTTPPPASSGKPPMPAAAVPKLRTEPPPIASQPASSVTADTAAPHVPAVSGSGTLAPPPSGGIDAVSPGTAPASSIRPASAASSTTAAAPVATPGQTATAARAQTIGGSDPAAAQEPTTTGTVPQVPPPQPLATRPSTTSAPPLPIGAAGPGSKSGSPPAAGQPRSVGAPANADTVGDTASSDPGDVSAADQTMAITAAATPTGGQPVPAMQQVLGALRSLVGQATTGGVTAAASGASSSRAAAPAEGGRNASVAALSGGSVTLQLDPEHLGRVSITVHLRADALDVKIAVENGQTLTLLDKDRHVLSAALDASGRKGEVDLTPAATQEAALEPSSSGGQAQSADGQSLLHSSSGRNRQGDDDRSGRSFSLDSSDDEPAVPVGRHDPRSDGSLYV